MINDWSEFEPAHEIPITTAQPVNGKMIVVVSQPELEYTGRFGWMNDGGDGWNLSTDSLTVSFVAVDVVKSGDSLYHVHVNRFSHGKTRQDAINRANQIEYSVSSIDSVLDLANGFSIYKESKFRGQRVQVLVEVPVGKKILFDESVRNKLHDFDGNHRGNRVRTVNINGVVHEDVEYWWNPGVEYTMQPNGELKDNRGRTPAQQFDEYRYNEEPQDSADAERIKKEKLDERERRINEKERDLQEEKRKLEEEKQKRPSQVTVHKESIDDEEDHSLSGSPSPVLSMVKTFF
jgi:hypothetical protein